VYRSVDCKNCIYRELALRLSPMLRCNILGSEEDAGLALIETREKIMTKFLFAAAVATVAIATPAMAATDPVTFENDGISYTYSTKKVGDLTVIEGTSAPGGRIYLEVRGTRVKGVINSTRVAFDVPARKDRNGQLAAR
jgi:hypothetical protein